MESELGIGSVDSQTDATASETELDMAALQPEAESIAEPPPSDESADSQADDAGSEVAMNIEALQPEAEAIAEPLPEEIVIGPERAEIYHSPDRNREIEPGLGSKPSFDEPPDDAAAAKTLTQALLGLSSDQADDSASQLSGSDNDTAEVSSQ